MSFLASRGIVRALAARRQPVDRGRQIGEKAAGVGEGFLLGVDRIIVVNDALGDLGIALFKRPDCVPD